MVPSRASSAGAWGAAIPPTTTDGFRRTQAAHQRQWGTATGSSMPHGLHRAHTGSGRVAALAIKQPTSVTLKFILYPLPVVRHNDFPLCSRSLTSTRSSAIAILTTIILSCTRGRLVCTKRPTANFFWRLSRTSSYLTSSFRRAPLGTTTLRFSLSSTLVFKIS